MITTHLFFTTFFLALGACVGSFLNVVVWRLPRDESLISPGSHCPKCNTPLAWYDNIPVIGWIKLKGKCRHCKQPISPRYPIVEAFTALLFAFYYVMFFIFQHGPCSMHMTKIEDTTIISTSRQLFIDMDWPIFCLDLYLIGSLLAASLIDAELFIIPIEIPWIAAGLGIAVHTLIDRPNVPGNLILSPLTASLAAGGTVGLGVSLLLWWRGWLPQSFPQGEPILDVDREAIAQEIEDAKREGREVAPLPPEYTRWQIYGEIRKEMVFLMPPMIGAALWFFAVQQVPAIGNWWMNIASQDWLGGLLGSLFGAMVGGAVVWITRILGTLGFGRVAMGLGDVHLMFGVGAVLGAGASTVAFFLAPFFGILFALYSWISRSRRELPYGPFLSLATGFVVLFYCPIEAWLTPGMEGLVTVIRSFIHPG